MECVVTAKSRYDSVGGSVLGRRRVFLAGIRGTLLGLRLSVARRRLRLPLPPHLDRTLLQK